MIVLTSTEKLQLVLSAGTADVDVNYNDRTATAYGPADSQQTAATAATNDICTAPAASTSREINEVTVSVKTTGGTATLQKFNSSGSVTTIVWKGVVGASDQVFYVHGYGIKVTDANGNIKTTNTVTQRTRQVFLSGSSATYTTPANCKQILVRAKGGGGGGAASGASASGTTSGSVGGTTIFNSVNANGGGAGILTNNNGAAGGTGGSGTASLRLSGCPGGSINFYVVSATNQFLFGGFGGGNGGGRGGNNAPGAGGNGVANSGGGGGSAGLASATFVTLNASDYGAGGGEGEYIEILINTPASTYTYTVGSGGAGGTAGTAGANGGAGGSGFITVDEYY